jgi:predicted SnoaL-like aldol condensation-catalyzing enzyme
MTETTGTEATETERNRKLVLEGFAEFARGNMDILRTLLREDFLEHSPGNPSGRDAFIDFIVHAPVAGARLELRRTVADGQYVVMHYLMTPAGDERGTAVVDIWRLENGLIVEHWDVKQPIPEPAEIPHGMF